MRTTGFSVWDEICSRTTHGFMLSYSSIIRFCDWLRLSSSTCTSWESVSMCMVPMFSSMNWFISIASLWLLNRHRKHDGFAIT